MNPLKKLPENLRLGIYVVATILGLAWAAYETAQENWRLAIPIFLGSLTTLTAGSNVK